MSTSVVDPCITYRDEYVCGCERTILVAAKGVPGAFVGDGGYLHCGKDVPHLLPGPLYAVWERHDDNWIAI